MQASITETITLGHTLGHILADIAEGHKFTSGNKIGGKFNSGPGQICLGAINSGNAGMSGICTTNGTDGFGKLMPQQNSLGGVGL